MHVARRYPRKRSVAERPPPEVLGCLLDLGVAPELAHSVVEDDGMEAPHDGFWRTEEADIVQLSNGSRRGEKVGGGASRPERSGSSALAESPGGIPTRLPLERRSLPRLPEGPVRTEAAGGRLGVARPGLGAAERRGGGRRRGWDSRFRKEDP